MAKLIDKEFNVVYTIKQILVILKKFGMKHAKPYAHDYRIHEDAEDRLKKLAFNR